MNTATPPITTTLCVIVGEFTDSEDDFNLEQFVETRKEVEALVGQPAREGITAGDSVDLFFEDMPYAGLALLTDKLNDMDYVKLAHFRFPDGGLYPNI